MKKRYKQTNVPPARGDERSIIITSLILFIVSTIIRHLGPDGTSYF